MIAFYKVSVFLQTKAEGHLDQLGTLSVPLSKQRIPKVSISLSCQEFQSCFWLGLRSEGTQTNVSNLALSCIPATSTKTILTIPQGTLCVLRFVVQKRSASTWRGNKCSPSMHFRVKGLDGPCLASSSVPIDPPLSVSTKLKISWNSWRSSKTCQGNDVFWCQKLTYLLGQQSKLQSGPSSLKPLKSKVHCCIAPHLRDWDASLQIRLGGPICESIHTLK